MDHFWDIKVGDLVVAGGVIVSWLVLKSQTMKFHENNIKELQHIKSRVDIMFEWFTKMIIGNNK